mmetsp:Transcript_43221/g.122449  ORF Transcript_43221/g.122449 Transcript_43221/m.122449 type:complete len:420 (-) Transcript_43221:784-2043(-)
MTTPPAPPSPTWPRATAFCPCTSGSEYAKGGKALLWSRFFSRWGTDASGDEGTGLTRTRGELDRLGLGLPPVCPDGSIDDPSSGRALSGTDDTCTGRDAVTVEAQKCLRGSMTPKSMRRSMKSLSVSDPSDSCPPPPIMQGTTSSFSISTGQLPDLEGVSARLTAAGALDGVPLDRSGSVARRVGERAASMRLLAEVSGPWRWWVPCLWCPLFRTLTWMCGAALSGCTDWDTSHRCDLLSLTWTSGAMFAPDGTMQTADGCCCRCCCLSPLGVGLDGLDGTDSVVDWGEAPRIQLPWVTGKPIASQPSMSTSLDESDSATPLSMGSFLVSSVGDGTSYSDIMGEPSGRRLLSSPTLGDGDASRPYLSSVTVRLIMGPVDAADDDPTGIKMRWGRWRRTSCRALTICGTCWTDLRSSSLE